MDVSIVIPTYNRKKVLKRCLELLFAQNYPKDKYEIILVDDGSTDGTDKMVASLNPPCRFTYLYQERKGPHIARNLGITHAEGEIVIFIDSDILCPPDLISEHIKYHNRFKDVIVSGPETRTSDLYDKFQDIEKRKFKKFWDLSGPSFITSNLSVKRKYLIRIGGFDEEFEGMGWHDWDLGLRLTKLGLIPKRNLDAIVYHYKEKRELTTLSELIQKRIERGKNAVLYYKKHPSLKIKLGIRVHHLIKDKLLWWLDSSLGDKITNWAIKNNEKFLLNLLIQWKLDKAYAKGLREGMKKYKIKLLPWM
ncbi:MAG TPA: glycosyltransferase family 2 protein [Candidatus Aerophobetes bacterium]|uniref:Glycosyltransferase family 2 protein n=1 Tax=Aerophobetes bacterium TaxID=2030807 RepID=A0A7V0QT50_UNCAE|nr:glycosyltransferase family 2 protein [Candidatus Aerophobetes bacterium]